MAKVLSEVAPTFLPNCPAVPELRAVLARVEAAGIRRNEIVHGTWGSAWLAIGSRMIPPFRSDKVLNQVTKRRGAARELKHWTAQEIYALSGEIAQIRLDLNRVMHPLPYPVGMNLSIKIPVQRYDLPPPWGSAKD
jgi:hypothetical protein